jgi:hypothetical protein
LVLEVVFGRKPRFRAGLTSWRRPRCCYLCLKLCIWRRDLDVPRYTTPGARLV